MSEEKAKKPFYKKWWVWVIAGFLLIGFLGGGGNDNTPTPATSQPQSTQEQQPEPPKNKPSMSKSEFDQLKGGMTYEEATAIIGGPGEVISESGNPGEQLHTVMYQYEGEGDIGANANLMFQGNKLNNKAQFGLK